MSEVNQPLLSENIPDETLMKMPPAGGVYTVPNVNEFVAIINSFSKIYRNPDEAIRNSRENAKTMRRSPLIMEPLRARQMATAELAWHVEPEDPKDEEHRKIAKELTRIIEDIPDFMQFKMSLLEAVFFGRWANQIKYKWDFSTGIKRLVVDSWIPQHGDSLVFRWDKPGKVGVLVNNIHYGDGTKHFDNIKVGDVAQWVELSDWQREAFVFHKHEITAGDFFEPEASGGINGIGLRHYLYWTWFLLMEAMGWMTEYMERIGMGMTIFRFPGGNSQAEAATRTAAEAQAFSNVILWPAYENQTWKDVERVEPSGVGIESLLKIIQDFYGGQLKRMILGQVLSSEAATVGATKSTADFQQDTFERIVKYDSTNLAESLTRDLVNVLMKYNYPGCPYKMRFRFNVDKPDPEAYLRSANQFYNMGGDIDADELREMIGLSKPVPGSTILRRAMTGMEMGAQGGINDGLANQPEDSKSHPGNDGETATKIDAIKKSLTALGGNAKANEIEQHLLSQGLKVSRSLVYDVLHRLRGPTQLS